MTTAPDPAPLVTITRYTVSVLPRGDVNHRYHSLQVDLRARGWIVTDGHSYFGPNGGGEFSESTAHHFADYDEALALARHLAPGLGVNGRTAVDAFRHTMPTVEQEPIPLRWGHDDVMWGDDDSVTLLLSGPGGAPYVLELDPTRAASLRADLAGPDGTLTPDQGEHGYPEGQDPTDDDTDDDIQNCRCVEFCHSCSLSGRRHVHPASEHPEYGPCPVHPDAPGDH